MTLGDVQIRKAAAAGLITGGILGQISDEELRDRFAYSAELAQQADRATGRERARLIEKSRAVMQAPPREVTEREVQAMITKAATLGNGHAADALRRRANALLEDHPPAPRRQAAPARTAAGRSVTVAKSGTRPAVRLVYDRAGRACAVEPSRIKGRIAKAASGKADGQVAVFDQAGNLVGICDADDITRVQGADAPASNEPAQPGQADGQAEVAKARRRAAPRRPVPAQASFDGAGNLTGFVRGGRFAPLQPAARRAAAVQIAKMDASAAERGARLLGPGRMAPLR